MKPYFLPSIYHWSNRPLQASDSRKGRGAVEVLREREDWPRRSIVRHPLNDFEYAGPITLSDAALGRTMAANYEAKLQGEACELRNVFLVTEDLKLLELLKLLKLADETGWLAGGLCVESRVHLTVV